MFKGEVARINGIDYTVGETLDLSGIDPDLIELSGFEIGDIDIISLPTGTVSRNRSDIMLGVEYYGIGNTVLTFEVVNRHISDFDSRMSGFAAQQDTQEISMRYDGTFINDKMDVSALLLLYSGKDNFASVTRLQVSYELYEALNVSGGVLMYKDADIPPFNEIGENDRVFAEMKWSF